MFDLRKQILTSRHMVSMGQGMFKALHSLSLYDDSAIMVQVQAYRKPILCDVEFGKERTIYLKFPTDALPGGLEVILIG